MIPIIKVNPKEKPVADGWIAVPETKNHKYVASSNYSISSKKIPQWKLDLLGVSQKSKRSDMYGSDSPLYIELGEVRPVIDKWLTRDLTDPEYQYKITETAREHLIRDVCYLIFRKIPMLIRQELQVPTTPMKPAKKAGQKVKRVNVLKKAVTAKAKKSLKTKKK